MDEGRFFVIVVGWVEGSEGSGLGGGRLGGGGVVNMVCSILYVQVRPRRIYDGLDAVFTRSSYKLFLALDMLEST